MKRIGIALLIAVLLLAACGDKPQEAKDALPHTVYMPVAGYYIPTPVPTADPALGCFGIERAVAIYRYVATDGRQARTRLVCHPSLVAAARERAATLAAEGDISHCDKSGECANSVAQRYGCTLPADYVPNGNNIEDIVAGTPDALAAFLALAASPSHSTHLFARDPAGNINLFFYRQTDIGIALHSAPGSLWGYYWVILIAECQLPQTASPMLQ